MSLILSKCLSVDRFTSVPTVALSLPQSPSSCQQKTTRSNHVRCMPGHLFNSFSSSSGGHALTLVVVVVCAEEAQTNSCSKGKQQKLQQQSKEKCGVAMHHPGQIFNKSSWRSSWSFFLLYWRTTARHGTVDLQRNIATRKWLNIFFLPFIIHPPRSSLYNIPTQKCLFRRKQPQSRIILFYYTFMIQ